MLAAVIALSLLAVTLGGGLVYAMKQARDERKEAQAAGDLYRKQCEVTFELESERKDLIGKLTATDAQLKEASAKIVRLEISLDKAQQERTKQTEERIRRASNPLTELSNVLQERAELPAVPKADASSGSGEAASLLIQDLK